VIIQTVQIEVLSKEPWHMVLYV